MCNELIQIPCFIFEDTGTGKTTIVEVLSLIHKAKLHSINCHATTETSDLLGGLRPLRGRSALADAISSRVNEFVCLWQVQIGQDSPIDPTSYKDFDNVQAKVNFVQVLWESLHSKGEECVKERTSKRPKLDLYNSGGPIGLKGEGASLVALRDEILLLNQRYLSLFEWVDGPLVEAMKFGDFVLLDEMSLADDAVLERLNSVLEPSRTIVLAEKGSVDSDVEALKAKDGFQLFATMNPGGDFGKRELSPALRNRFTEIWVPQITDLGDIELALDKRLTCVHAGNIKDMMIDYLKWFNAEICCAPSSPSYELSLSLRDVLAWADFVVSASETCTDDNIWQVYREGAYLMHLDGIGLGTGMGKERADEVKAFAEVFLSNQLSKPNFPVTSVPSPSSSKECQWSGEKFGITPFFIDCGATGQCESTFHFEAPTTARNLYRVLRALQLSKPVLIEGPPGAGKTSLVEALAAASGHQLVRINLSEQSDVSDLFGSDLPLPGDSSTQGSFQWCDGVLLSAIKAGCWVLLDELNLAPQSVLEGLNSCLDHRSAVFIPEIGQTFACPASFRIFAAQNPISQGGGRKGLPKSFLNRFTKVYVEELTSGDFTSIVQSRYPSVPRPLVLSIVDFTSQVHDHVALMNIGSDGGPWEFNLRDVCRWCDLLTAAPLAGENCAHFARDLYVQRFRTKEDRDFVASLYQKCFEDLLIPPFDDLTIPSKPLKVTLDRDKVQVGEVVLARTFGYRRPLYEPQTVQPNIYLSLAAPLEACARCIAMRWPCLLVGRSTDANAAIIHVLSELVGIEVIELSLSSSSDVSELIGCFEQMSAVDKAVPAIQALVDVATRYVAQPVANLSPQILDLIFKLTRRFEENSDMQSALSLGSLLLNVCHGDLEEPDQVIVDSSVKILEHLLDSQNGVGSLKGRFTWKDGPLVKAMQRGCWLHLRNVNLCPSTVLDRLNSLLEPNGALLLAECGASEDLEAGTAHLELVPHPNFVIFLSMNPDQGEISRAMRNRCVEVSVLGTLDNTKAFVDARNVGWKAGSRVPFVESHFEKDFLTRIARVREIARCVAASSLRGMNELRLKQLHDPVSQSVFALRIQDVGVSDLQSGGSLGALPCPSLRDGWLTCPKRASLEWDAQLLRPLVFRHGLLSYPGCSGVSGSVIQEYRIPMSLVRDIFLNRFLHGRDTNDYATKSRFLSRLQVSSANALRLLAARSLVLQEAIGTSNAHSLDGDAELVHFLRFLQLRGPQHLQEARWQMLAGRGTEVRLQGASVLLVSYLLHCGKTSNLRVSCPVTPLLYPLFLALDEWWNMLLPAFFTAMDTESASVVAGFTQLLKCRDELWNHLSEATFAPQGSTSLHFDGTEFMILWEVFRATWSAVVSPTHQNIACEETSVPRKASEFVQAIDTSIYGMDGENVVILRAIRSRVVRPLVPRTAQVWAIVLSIHGLGRSFSIFGNVLGGPNKIGLAEIFAEIHPILFWPLSLKQELVALLCTAYISAMKSEGSLSNVLSPNLDSKISSLLQNEIRERARVFEAKTECLRLESPLLVSDPRNGDMNAVDTGESGATLSEVSDDLLTRFARIQLAPLVEYWFEYMEGKFSEALCGTLLRNGPDDATSKQLLSHSSLSRFTDLLLTYSQWVPSEIYPFQTIAWLLEAGQLNDESTERLLPAIRSNSLMHEWKGSRQHFAGLSFRLELPFQYGVESRSRKFVSARVPGHVPTATVFAMIGQEFQCRSDFASVPSFVTIENFRAREIQAQELLILFARLSAVTPFTPVRELSFTFLKILKGLGAFRGGGGGITQFVESLTNVCMSVDHHDATIHKILPGILPSLVPLNLPENFVLSVWDSLRKLWCSSTTDSSQPREVAITRVKLGLLMFHMLLPESPVDPGLRPLGELNILSRRFDRLEIEQFAVLLEQETSLDGATREREARRLELERESITRERDQTAEMVVTRPPDVPNFASLYQETHDFARSVMQVDSITRLIDSFSHENARVRIALNWEKTAELFCDRLLTTYQAYEDVTAPLVEAIGNVRSGLHAMRQACSYPTQSHLSSLVTGFTRIPMLTLDVPEILSSTELLLGLADRPDFCMALLSRTVLSRQVFGLSRQLTLRWRSLVERLLRLESAKAEILDSALSEEERREKKFKEIFPDYRGLFQAPPVGELEDDLERELPEDCINTRPNPSENLLNNHIELLVEMHREFFSEDNFPTGKSRGRAFRLGYNLAFRLHEDSMPHLSTAAYSGHAMALSMCNVSGNGSLPEWHLSTVNDDCTDFYKDPCPKESIQAADPLRQISGRVVQLLSTFPDNSILTAIAAAAERIQRLSLLSTSLGQVVVGLEVVLKNAQDWEQHASMKFRIGDPLKLISGLVAKWRRFELESWPSLLRTREKRLKRRSWDFWIQLHSLLGRQRLDASEEGPTWSTVVNENVSRLLPRWVWKGSRAVGQKICAPIASESEDVSDLVKVLDTFLLTASIAEFETRLGMLWSFVVQQDLEWSYQRVPAEPCLAAALARSLRCLWCYYNQFLPTVRQRMASLKKTFEKQLADLTKLARWDEQSYYSLAESTERYHRKIMSILNDYEEALELNVSVVLEDDLCSGIRGNSEMSDGESNLIPSQGILFPVVADHTVVGSPGISHNAAMPTEARTWQDATSLGASPHSYCASMRRLAPKIVSVCKQNRDVKSNASRGSIGASELTDAIFARIQSLRSDKATRPMKERALVDLMKKLKFEGFVSTKWGTPQEVRLMSQVCQLPTWGPRKHNYVSLAEFLPVISSCDAYVQRCLAEATRLRSEVGMFGSQNLSSKQMGTMLSISDSGLLLLLQQRCAFLAVMQEREKLAFLLGSIERAESTIPSGQTILLVRFQEWMTKFRLSTESLAQLCALVKNTIKLASNRSSATVLESIHSTLDSYLQEVEVADLSFNFLVTRQTLLFVKQKHAALLVATETLQSFRKRVCESIPVDALDHCVVFCQEALSSSRSILDHQANDELTMSSPSMELPSLAVTTFLTHVTDTVEALLLSIQVRTQPITEDDSGHCDIIWECHNMLLKTWASVDLRKLAESFANVLISLRVIHDKDGESHVKNSCTRLAADLRFLVDSGMSSTDELIRESLAFHRESSKLVYVLIRVFRVLVSKGFCQSKERDEGGDNADGQAGESSFEDKAGTGMGDGEGSKDVTEQLETEDQLLGLKGNEENGKEREKPQQLDKEESNSGMEMEADFEGDVFDVPQASDEDQSATDEEGEELDREMGDEEGLNDQVIDERMWNQDVDEDLGGSQDKLEENNNVKGNGSSDEMTTKEEDNEAENGDVGATHEPKVDSGTNEADETDQDGQKMEDSPINDGDDNHEDYSGMQVREDGTKEDDEDDGLGGVADELDDNLNLDGEDGSTGNPGDDDNENPLDPGLGEEIDTALDQPPSPDSPVPDGETEQSECNTDETNPFSVELEEQLDPHSNQAGDDDERRNPCNNTEESKAGLGVGAEDGKDVVDTQGLDSTANGEGENADTEIDVTGPQATLENGHSTGGGDSDGGTRGESATAGKQEASGNCDRKDLPNPLKSPGDALKYWHRKLNVIGDNSDEVNPSPIDANEMSPDAKVTDGKGEFEHTDQMDPDTTQVLGDADEENGMQFDHDDTDTRHEVTPEIHAHVPKEEMERQSTVKKKRLSERRDVDTEKQLLDDSNKAPDGLDGPMEVDEVFERSETEDVDSEGRKVAEHTGNHVGTDLSQIQHIADSPDEMTTQQIIVDDDLSSRDETGTLQTATKWSQIQGETHHLSRRLCEKLRLVLEPLVASKLRGDYRTGKRINMKRVVGYIASGYRRDKIWLRRTKPAKRNYRVLVAVDDSESMHRSGAGEMALRAMATLATGMSHLDIGQIGLASFGEEMRLLHPFDLPFNSDCGSKLVQSFTFSQKRTRTALCVESTMMALNTPGDHASLQLVFLISDGRIERDSRATLRRLLREMFERNILLALIIVEGDSKRDSLLNMKEVTFVNGKPHVKRFIEDFPFPYYIILEDMQALPEILGDALSQWFEMLARLQGT